MLPYVERSRGWNGSKINNNYIVSQFRMSHGLQGCKIKKGESKLLSPHSRCLSRHAKLGALHDKTKGRL